MDKTPFATLFIGMAASLYMAAIALTATASGESAYTALTILTINFYVVIVAAVFTIIGALLGLMSIKADSSAKVPVAISFFIMLIFAVGYGIVSAVL